MVRIFNQYVSTRSLTLMVLEGFLAVMSLLGAAWLRFWNDPSGFALYVSLPDFATQSLLVTFVCLICFYFNDLYDLSDASGGLANVLRIEQSLGAACLLLGLLYSVFPALLLGRGVFLLGMGLFMGCVLVSRGFIARAWHLAAPLQRVLVPPLQVLQLVLRLQLQIP